MFEMNVKWVYKAITPRSTKITKLIDSVRIEVLLLLHNMVTSVSKSFYVGIRSLRSPRKTRTTKGLRQRTRTKDIRPLLRGTSIKELTGT